MALTYGIVTQSKTSGGSATITSPSLASLTGAVTAVATGDWIDVIHVAADNQDQVTFTITNTNTAITWTKSQETDTNNNCRVTHWTGTAGASAPGTISVQALTGNLTTGAKALMVIVQRGQHATTPLPAGNLFLVASGTDRTQAITPTSTGSNLWMAVGDWNAMNSFTNGTNNTQPFTAINISGQMTSALTAPTTQPRTNTSAFTLSINDTGGAVIGVAWEVQTASAGGASPNTPTVSDTATLTESVDMRMHLKNTASNDTVTLTESVSMSMNLGGFSVQDAITLVDAPTMHMPISLRMEKLS